jgi:alanine dehydrogenase
MENPIQPQFNIGLPRMRKEAGERRVFLPRFVANLRMHGANVILEHGYGEQLGSTDEDYSQAAPGVIFTSHEEALQQDHVLVLRCPNDDELELMRPGSCLISMLHYPTRPQRVEQLRSLGLEAISLDSLTDDVGRRLVENLRSVAWNGVEVAFKTLQNNYPAEMFFSPERGPIHVTLLGAGAVGIHVVQAAVHYGNDAVRKRLYTLRVPGVQVTAVDYDLTLHPVFMQQILSRTEILVDATQRPDPSKYVIPNAWISYLPEHAVILDLSVDPYNCDSSPVSVKGIEGVPQGNLDQYVFAPNDPAFDALPGCVNTRYRRWSVSCYSWPGIYPRKCMRTYGAQVQPVINTIIDRGGLQNVSPNGRYFERVISRALLSRWGVEETPNPA